MPPGQRYVQCLAYLAIDRPLAAMLFCEALPALCGPIRSSLLSLKQLFVHLQGTQRKEATKLYQVSRKCCATFTRALSDYQEWMSLKSMDGTLCSTTTLSGDSWHKLLIHCVRYQHVGTQNMNQE